MSKEQIKQTESLENNIGGEAMVHGFVVRSATVKSAEKSWPD